MTIRITGTLARAAECRISHAEPQHATICVQLAAEHPCDLAVEACWRVPGEGFSAIYAANNAAEQLRKGTRVTLYAAALVPWGGGHRARLRDVECIRADDDIRTKHYLEALDR